VAAPSAYEQDATGGGPPFDEEAHVRRLALVGELTASVLHQINGPVTYLLLNLEQLEKAVTAPDACEALREARHGAEIIRELARDVMRLSRGGAQRLDSLDIRSIVESALNITSAHVRAVAVVVEEYADSPRVRGDATLLLQVVVNGLVNAADACEADGARGHAIRVSVGTDVAGNAFVSIADDGRGVSREHVARVFDAFFTTKEPGRGTGLGLSLAKRVVELTGGHITFDSTEGVGSVLRITWPATEEDG
jgi:signal transduction histidine kinase